MKNTIIGFALALGFIGASHAQISPPKDPYFTAKGSWGQRYEDQWAMRRVGFDETRQSAWRLVKKNAKPVIVAVIDTGLDWNHQDIAWDAIWRNPGEIDGNGIDDDGNGFVDDIIGWDFFANSPKAWDHDGHGTFVAGIIAATHNNKAGIAGINPNAKIMVLKAINNFGHSRASFLARALIYAADNGAQVVNMSVGGKELSDIEQDAIAYAHAKGVVIIVAAGNEGVNVDTYGIAASDKVITVASSDLKDKRTIFSNWGKAIDIAAPGIDVLSLRARRTDTMRDIPGVEYKPGDAYVGDDKRLYRASGTSFSAPIVAGVASLIVANNPRLRPDEVRRILVNSARDIGVPGIDQYSGYGMLDARKALSNDAAYYIDAAITAVGVVSEAGGQVLQVTGTADADRFVRARLELGVGEAPTSWSAVGKPFKKSVRAGILAQIPPTAFRGATVWTLKLIVDHRDGSTRETQYRLTLG